MLSLVRPVETGHELILATLLLHFHVDDVAHLLSEWQPVVRDVYDIAASLAEAKVAYQWELATLRAEHERIRAELASEQSVGVDPLTPRAREARSTASASSSVASPPMTQGPQLSKRAATFPGFEPHNENTNVRRDSSAEARRTIACAGESLAASAPQWNSSTKLSRERTAPQLSPMTKFKNESAKFGRSAHRRWVTAPVRLPAARKLFSIASAVPMATPTTLIEHTQRDRVASTATAWNVHMKSPDGNCAPGCEEGVRSQSRRGEPHAFQSRSSVCSAVTEGSSDCYSQKCIAQQLACEKRLHGLHRTLGQISQWDLKHNKGELIVIVRREKARTHHSVHDIRAALAYVCDEVEAIRQSSIVALGLLGAESSDLAWVYARHTKLLEMMSEIEEWVEAIARLVNRFSGTVFAGPSRGDSSRHLWAEVGDRRGSVKHQTNRRETEILRHRQSIPTSWKHLTPVFIEYAVSSLLMRGIEIYVTVIIQAPTHESLIEVGEVARELQALLDRFQTTKRKLANENLTALQWEDAILVRHAMTLKAIQRRATICSESICRVPPRLRCCHDVSLPRVTTTALTSFPPDWFSWSLYEDLVLAIVSSHVTFTRLAEAKQGNRKAVKNRFDII